VKIGVGVMKNSGDDSGDSGGGDDGDSEPTLLLVLDSSSEPESLSAIRTPKPPGGVSVGGT
jgi:hypothetical protein